ncbi:MAG: hypothetical protein AB7E81_19160 [Hyphomicrobiaceae bacterium]
MLKPGILDFLERLVVDVPQINTVNLGAERACNGLYANTAIGSH